jgi:DNA-binding transcriptional LysR family regulator
VAIHDQQGIPFEQPIISRMRVLNDALGTVAWVNAGGGLYQAYHFAVSDAVRQSDLVEVLQQFGGRSQPFSIRYLQNRRLSARVHAFVDFLRSAIKS